MSATLEVQVKRAEGVRASDPNGKSDPYCIVSLAASDVGFRTDTCQATLDPLWNETFTISASSLAPFVHSSDTGSFPTVQLYGYLVLEVWDRDTVNPDDFLGRVVIPLSSLQLGSSGEVWYTLKRRGVKESVCGSIGVKLCLHLEGEAKLNYADQNTQLYEACKAKGFHIPVLSNQTILELPGKTEEVEMAFSHVIFEISSFYGTAKVFLTNYRLIILATGDKHSQREVGGQDVANDNSMWIALNNIQSVETDSNAFRIRRNILGQQQNANTRAIKINCYDIRQVKLVFILDSDEQNLSDGDGDALGFLPSLLASRREGGGGGGGGGGGSPKVGRKLLRVAGDKMLRLRSRLPERGRFRGKKGRWGRQRGRAELPHCLSESFVESQEVPVELNFRTLHIPSTDCSTSYSSRVRSGALLFNHPRSSSFSHIETRCSNSFLGNDKTDESDSSEDEEEEIIGGLIFDNDDTNEGVLTLAIDRTDKICLAPPTPSDELVQALSFRLEDVTMTTADYPPARHFVKCLSGVSELLGWDVYNFPKEMDRQGVSEDHWKLVACNGPQYELCHTYPQLLYVPSSLEEETLLESAKFRSKQRLPCLVWVDKKKRNFMLRSAQPLPGASGKHSKEDELLIQKALESGPEDGHLMIYDARSFSAAAGNKIMGKGTEDIGHYANTRLTYLDIPNIHAVRDSYESLKSVCLSSTSAKWYSALENTQWISYISLILKGASMIARYLKLQRGSVLVHCSDGWDRTAQLTSLSQMLMDAYYRTIEGFKVLIEKEWLSFGHKFQQRLGHPTTPNERSPIFLQFLDCVHQIMWQYPNAFEFNRSFLLRIAEHINTAWFGTFLCNCDRERHEHSLYATTLSLWAHLTADQSYFINRDFKEVTKPIFPVVNIRRLRLWEEYFLHFDPTHFTQQEQAKEHMSHDKSHDLVDHPAADQAQSWSTDTVVWVSNNKSTECSFCQQKFTPFKRKHHCRACGNIFCNDCSKQRLPLGHLGYYLPVRVCDECHSKLHGAQSSKDAEDGFVLVSKRCH